MVKAVVRLNAALTGRFGALLSWLLLLVGAAASFGLMYAGIVLGESRDHDMGGIWAVSMILFILAMVLFSIVGALFVNAQVVAGNVSVERPVHKLEA